VVAVVTARVVSVTSRCVCQHRQWPYGMAKPTVGSRIRQLRISMRLTQEQLAEAAEISRDGLVRIERGNRRPQLETLTALSKALGVPVDKLVNANARTQASPQAVRIRRIEVAMSKLPDGYAQTIVEVVEKLCSAARAQLGVDPPQLPHGD
jgi:transcriptional regulator with XRE-family HTH domain